jgi:hypothetical protein
MLRVIIPAATALVVGCQIVLSSFFLSVLGCAGSSNTSVTTPSPRNRVVPNSQFACPHQATPHCSRRVA